jgi:transcriptional regulator with XRE-family HTH domain
MTINDRIRILIDKLAKGKQNAFAETTGIKTPTINGIVGPRQSEPSFSTLKKIVDSYPIINLNWLIKEEGEPFLKPLPEKESLSDTELKLRSKDSLAKIKNSAFLTGNLKRLREHVQMTQSSFGKIFNMTRDQVASCERGFKPGLSFLIDIENYFHISFDELIAIDLKEHPEILKKISVPDSDNKNKKPGKLPPE